MIYVIGHSKTGKSPVAKRIADHFGFPIIEAGGWARQGCPPLEDETTEEYVPRVSQYALEKLKTDPWVAIRHVDNGIKSSGDKSIIVGIRNPFDFAQLVDPSVDHVIFIESDTPMSDFESEGISLIRGMVKLYKTVFANPSCTLRCPHPDTQEAWGVYLDKMATNAIAYLEANGVTP